MYIDMYIDTKNKLVAAIAPLTFEGLGYFLLSCFSGFIINFTLLACSQALAKLPQGSKRLYYTAEVTILDQNLWHLKFILMLIGQDKAD